MNHDKILCAKNIFSPIELRKHVFLSFREDEAKKVHSKIRPETKLWYILEFAIANPTDTFSGTSLKMHFDLTSVAGFNRRLSRLYSPLRVVCLTNIPFTGGWQNEYKIGTLKETK